jgi:hypothetical protein
MSDTTGEYEALGWKGGPLGYATLTRNLQAAKAFISEWST